MHLLTYAYNTPLHSNTNASSYNLVLRRLPPGPSLIQTGTKRRGPHETEALKQRVRALLRARILVLRNKTDVHMRSRMKFISKIKITNYMCSAVALLST